MARPIKDTPVLRGADAVRFMEEMWKTEHPTPEMIEKRKKERKKIEEDWKFIKKIAAFPL